MVKKRLIKGHQLLMLNEQDDILLAISETIQDTTMEMAIEGSLTADVSFEFEDELIAAMTVCDNIVIDFKGVTGITSAGLKALLSVQKMIDEMNGKRLALKNISPAVAETFEEVGFDGLFEIEEKE